MAGPVGPVLLGLKTPESRRVFPAQRSRSRVAPSRGGTRRLDRPSWTDARTPPATRPRAAPGPRPAPRLGPVGDGCAGRGSRRLPGEGRPLPHVRGDGRGDPGRSGRLPRHRVHPLDRQELPASRPVGRQGLGPRRHRRGRAGGHVRFAASRPRAPVARAEPRAAALADHGLRHGRPDHPHRQQPRDLDRVRGQPGRRRVRPHRLAVPGLAQEPPAQRRDERDRHRPQPELRLSLGLLRRLVSLEVVGDVSRVECLLDARDACDPRLHGQPPDRRPPADQDRDHVPLGGCPDPVAVRLHEDRRAVGHDRRRPRRARRPGQEDGPDQRLHGDAVEQPVHHRRRRDRLGLRPRAHLHVHVRALPEPQPGQLDRAVLPAGRGHRTGDRAQQGGHPDPDRGGRLPVRGDRQDEDALRPAVRRPRDLRRLDRQPSSARTRPRPAHGSARTRRRPPARPAPSRPARGRWSPAPRPARRRPPTTSTAASRPCAPPRSSCRRRSAR